MFQLDPWQRSARDFRPRVDWPDLLFLQSYHIFLCQTVYRPPYISSDWGHLGVTKYKGINKQTFTFIYTTT